MDKFNLASEVGMRLAVFNRSVKNQLKGRNIDSLSKKEQDAIYTKAARSARELTDFNQGGRATKAADAAIPYLNAATQGTRAAVEAFNKNPLSTSIRILQITAYTSTATISLAFGLINSFRDNEDEEIKGMTNSEIYLKTIAGVSEYDLENYFIIPTGNKNKDGNWEYYRVAKAQALSPFFNTAEHYSRKAISENLGGTYEGDIVKILRNTVEKNLIPVEFTPTGLFTRIPAVNAAFAMQGINLYTGNPLSWDRGRIPEELEGITDDRVEPMFKEIGKLMEESPVRLQGAVESFITTPNTNPYIATAYALGNLVTSDDTIEETYSNVKSDMGRALTSRMKKNTSPYNEIAKLEEKASSETLEAVRKHILLEDKVRDVVKDFKSKKIDLEEVNEKIKEIAGESPDERMRIKSWVKSEVKKRKLTPLVSSLKYERNKEVRAIIIARKYGDAFLNLKNLDEGEKNIFKEFKKENVIDKEVYNYYKKLYSN